MSRTQGWKGWMVYGLWILFGCIGKIEIGASKSGRIGG